MHVNSGLTTLDTVFQQPGSTVVITLYLMVTAFVVMIGLMEMHIIYFLPATYYIYSIVFHRNSKRKMAE